MAQKNTIISWRDEARALRAELIREQVRHAAVQKAQARLEGRIEELESLVKVRFGASSVQAFMN